MKPSTVLSALNNALQRALHDDPRVLLLGEDILDPYGGAFKVTRGLSSAFADRVLTTPISEAGMVGAAAGMALRGLRPVVEIMFGDFTTLVVDQLANHAAKFRWMYNDQVSLPLVVRAPMGGRRGYGPTHSQSIEKLFAGVPGLRMLAPLNLPGPSGAPLAESLLYDAVLDNADPLLFVENKLQYLLPVLAPSDLADFDLQFSGEARCPSLTLTLRGAPPAALSLVAYGYAAELARQAALKLAYEHEIFAELVLPTQIAPLDAAPILASLARTRRLLVVEEGTRALGWGAEVLARAAETPGLNLHAAARLAAADTPIPASIVLEQAALPSVQEILQIAKKMV